MAQTHRLYYVTSAAFCWSQRVTGRLDFSMRGCVPREAGSLGAILEDQLPHGGDHLGWLLITLGLHSTLLRLHIGVKTRKLSPQRL